MAPPVLRKGKKVQELLTLLRVLTSVSPEKRVIMLAHLDDVSRDSLYQTIDHVLRSQKVPARKRLFLKSKLNPYKTHIRYLASKKVSSVQKKKKLTQMGAGPMNLILKAAIPLLLNLFSSS